MSVRWLHISDVHECERDGYHRTAMFDAIVAAVGERKPKLDFVFFTGDLAFSGNTEEYVLLRERFLDPLKSILPDSCPIFTVPGNHDVNRKRSVCPRLWMEDEVERNIFQQVGSEGRQKRNDMILPRLEGYRTIENEIGAWGEDWLDSDMGAICVTRVASGHQVAIVGINTAWLCHDKHDWGRLTAGKTMVEAALKQAEASSTDLTIVLGHHPLEAMFGEKPWSDGKRIRQRLEQANSIYLHGHLHKSGGQQTGDSMENVLAIQAPSGFQASDSDTWRNGIMWGEADIGVGKLIVEPLRWNNDYNAFVFDTDAAPPRCKVSGADAFEFALPGQKSPAAPEPPDCDIPEGWQIIDAAGLAEMTAERPSVEEMADWFDGSFPRWKIAAAKGVQPRQAADDLIRKYRSAHAGAPRPMVRLLTGAGGEGKSAALLQTAAGLLRDEMTQWSCFWRSASAADPPENWPALLPRKDGHAWIVAIDDAEDVGQAIAELLRMLGARTDVHVLLAAREADWMLRGNTDVQWQEVADFQRVPLAGLDEEDAQRIARTWWAWGDEAMGRLRGETPEVAAKALLGHAQEFAARKEEGAFLGALLITREGEDYRARVARLMEPLRGATGIGRHSLLDIYAMIAAMHAENQLYLSRAVLAYALGCEQVDLDRGPLRTLRREAMVDGGSAYILTRHRLIAEVACGWLNDNEYDIDRLYPFLARAAVTEFRVNYSRNPDITRWQYGLAQHFVNRRKSRWHVARTIARMLLENSPDNALYLTNLGGVLRKTGKPHEALALFSEHANRFFNNRAVLYEWSVAAGEAGDPGLNVWLGVRSVADDRGESLDKDRCKRSLAGLGKAFEKLGFASAQAACGRLGLRLPDLDDQTRGYLEDHAKAVPVDNEQSIEADIAIMLSESLKASWEAEPDNSADLDALIGEPDSYNYAMLIEVLSGKAPNRR